MSAVATWPAVTSSLVGTMSEARTAVRATISRIDEISRRTRSRRVKGTARAGRWTSMPFIGWSTGPGQASGDERADELAVGPATGMRREPAHHLAQVAGRLGAGGLHGLVDEVPDLRLAELLGQELAEDRDLGLFLGREVLATARAEGLDRLAPSLDLARDDRQQLVLGQRLAALLLEVVGRILDHPEGVAAQRITRPHCGGRLGLEAFLEGHRLCWHLGRVARCGARLAT